MNVYIAMQILESFWSDMGKLWPGAIYGPLSFLFRPSEDEKIILILSKL